MPRLLLAPLVAVVCVTGSCRPPAAPSPTLPSSARTNPVTAPARTSPTASPARTSPVAPDPIAPQPAAAATSSDGVAVEAPTGCLDRHTLQLAGGTSQDCYPHVCRAGRCLTRCADRRDCAGAQDPSELATQGWPLECMPSGECTPMPPDKVR